MNRIHFIRKNLIMVLFISLFTSIYASDFYQIQVYTINSETQEKRLDQYFEKAFIPACHRAGIEHIGVFKPILEDGESCHSIVLWIPFDNLSSFEKLPQIILEDKVYLKKGHDYINALYNNRPYQRIESILLKAFTGMPKYSLPKIKGNRSERVYELRSYQGPTEKYYRKKVEMFSEAGEIAIFKELQFNPLFFAEVISGKEMPNLMYMTIHENKQKQDENWKKFRVHHKWQELKSMKEYKNTVSHIDKYMLYPTEYSDF